MVILVTLFVLPMCLHSVSEAGVIFLLIEPGSRPGGMGQAHVAQVDDGFAGYWNPGAMAFNRRNQFALMHTNWFGDIFDDIYYEYLGWNNYIPDLGGNLGFHAIFLTYGTQDHTNDLGDWLGTFSSYEIALATTYSYQVSNNLGVGITFKFIMSDLAPEGQGSDTKGRGISYAFDLGLKRRDLFIPRLDLGFNLQNIGPNITYIDDEQSDPLPMNLRFGLSYRAHESEYNRFTINGDFNKLLANDDFVLQRLVTAWYDDGGFMSKREIDSMIFGIGAEYTYWNLLSMRGGWIHDQAGSIKGPSFGAGIQYTFNNRYLVFFDFAMQQAGELTDYNRTFTLGLEF